MREPQKIEILDGEKTLHFEVTPMSAQRAEFWLYRAIFLIAGGAGAGIDLDKIEAKDFTDGNFLRQLLSVDFEKAEPLLNDLLSCVKFQTEGGALVQVTPSTVDGMVAFPTTLFAIRAAVLKASYGFFGNGGLKKFLTQLRGTLIAIQ